MPWLVWPAFTARVAHHNVALLNAIKALLTQNMSGAGMCTQNWPMLLTM